MTWICFDEGELEEIKSRLDIIAEETKEELEKEKKKKENEERLNKFRIVKK